MTTAISATAISAISGSTVLPWVNDDLIWLLVVGFIVAFVLAFAVGANDVANSFGTTVGARVLTLRQACILGTVFETAGAVLLGAKVGEMIRKGIIDVGIYQTENGAEILMMGEVAAMIGAGIWQLIATVFKVPVSGTHSIVGACIGFSLVAVGPAGVNWANLGFIVASWFISPVLAGLMSVALYYFVQRFIIKAANPLKNGLKMLPVFYAVTIGINVFSILYSGAPLLGFDDVPAWGIILIALGGMIVTAIVVQCYEVPRMRAKETSNLDEYDSNCNDMERASQNTSRRGSIKPELVPLSSQSESSIIKQDLADQENELSTNEEQKIISNLYRETSLTDSTNQLQNGSIVSFAVQLTSSDSSSSLNERNSVVELKRNSMTVTTKTCLKEEKETLKQNDPDDEEDPVVVRHLFSSIQVLTACFASFAHGGNDVSNAIGPLIALWIVFWSGNVEQKSFTPWYLLVYGGAGISVGLWLFGRRVIETIGKDLTKMTPSRGFCIELMTAITVLLASNVGIPVSTTHCKVGAVVSIGWFRSRGAVQWSVVRNIAFAWFVTVPVSGLVSAGAMFILMQFL